MARSPKDLKEMHPCFAMGKRGNSGRIHLPVSPGCNIECRFCDRQINNDENRPGVTAQVISPLEAEDIIKRSIELCSDINVVGITGPGDTLATDYALETFKIVREKFPSLIKCMSTNGLLLLEKADDIIAAGIDTLTVTVNAVDPKIESLINDGIHYHGEYIGGVEGARILINNQLEGIRKVSAVGITVKVNTVLVPGINDDHIEEIAKTVKDCGAYIYNIIPLIPQHKLSDIKAPSCKEIDSARKKAEKYIEVFRHCAHCRADAIGVPGKTEFKDKIYLKRVSLGETFSHG
ncbi:MAG: radical SAM protein [Lachnospiraceae bacterium]|nr:radical SAM protein [Lachnospiraceae bacterium]